MSIIGVRCRLAKSVAGIALAVGAGSAIAQSAANLVPSQVVASGHAEVLIQPTNASFSVGIRTQAASAALAAADNAKITKAVNEALQAAEITRDELAGSRITVGPRWQYDESARRQKRAGFEAINTLRIETQHLDRVGSYLDAALNAGATEASDISFSAKNSDSARRQALSEAVAEARADAEAMAKAGGGRLGELVLLSTESMRPGVGFEEVMVTAQRRTREATATEVTPSEIKITATVLARWRFIPTATER